MNQINIQSLSSKIRQRLEDEDKNKTQKVSVAASSPLTDSLKKVTQQYKYKAPTPSKPAPKKEELNYTPMPESNGEETQFNYSPAPVATPEKSTGRKVKEAFLDDALYKVPKIWAQTLAVPWKAAEYTGSKLNKIPAYGNFMSEAVQGIDQGKGKAAMNVLTSAKFAGSIATSYGKGVTDGLNTKTGKAVISTIMDKTSNLGIKTAARGSAFRGDKDKSGSLSEFTLDLIMGVGTGQMAKLRGEYDPLYKLAYDSYLKERQDPTNSQFQQIMWGIQDSAPQSLIGVGLSLATTFATKNPKLGVAAAMPYYAALSTGEQQQEKGDAYSLGNIYIDTVGDSVLNAVLGGVFTTPAKVWVRLAADSQVEGLTEVLQTFGKFANDYANADEAGRVGIREDVSTYITSGAMYQEYIIGGVTGLIAGGGIEVLNTAGSVSGTKSNLDANGEVMSVSGKGNEPELEVETETPTIQPIELLKKQQSGETLTDVEINNLENAQAAFIDYSNAFQKQTVSVPAPSGTAPAVSVQVLPVSGKFSVKFAVTAGETGLNIDYNLTELDNTQSEATERALTVIENWIEAQRQNADISPETQTRLEDIAQKLRQPAPERATARPKPTEATNTPDVPQIAAGEDVPATQYAVGDAVSAPTIQGMKKGTVTSLSDNGKNATVKIGGVSYTVATSELETKGKKKDEEIKVTELTEKGEVGENRVVAFETGRKGKTNVIVYNSDKTAILEILAIEKAEEKYRTKNRQEIADLIVNGRFDNKTETWSVINNKQSSQSQKNTPKTKDETDKGDDKGTTESRKKSDVLGNEDLEAIKTDIETAIAEADLDIKVQKIEQYGSTVKGTQTQKSDYDIYVYYSGESKEDLVFNVLNDYVKENKITINDRSVDFNPVREQESGDIETQKKKDPTLKKKVLPSTKKKADVPDTGTEASTTSTIDLKIGDKFFDAAGDVNTYEGVYEKENNLVLISDSNNRELGNLQIIGTDELVSILDKQTEYKKRNEANAEFRKEQDQIEDARLQKEKELEAEKQTAKDIYAGFVEGKPEIQKSKIISILTTVNAYGGKSMERGEAVRQFVENNAEITVVLENKVKPMSRRKFNQASNEEQAAHENRIKEAGKKSVYIIDNFEVTKTEYDYAQWLVENPGGKTEPEDYVEDVTATPVQTAEDLESEAAPIGIGLTLTEQYPDVEISISESPTGITLHKIVVAKDQRGKGTGSKVMQQLVDYADTNGLRVVLTPTKDFGGAVGRLKTFYKTFGFVENKGRNKDFSTRETFIRSPKEVESDNQNVVTATANQTAEDYDQQNKPVEAETVRNNADTLTIVPDTLEEDIEVYTKAGLPKDSAKKKAKQKKRLFGGDEVVDRPNTLVKKTPLKDLLAGADRMVFTAVRPTENDYLYLHHKDETSETYLRPSALGLIEDNIQVGQEVILDASELKASGTFFRLIDKAGRVVGETLPEKVTELAQAVWHGSPYKWKRPDLGKTGTGEGNAAFGWGFYATEVEGIGREYKDQLSGRELNTNTIDENLTYEGKTLQQNYEAGVNKPEGLNLTRQNVGAQQILQSKGFGSYIKLGHEGRDGNVAGNTLDIIAETNKSLSREIAYNKALVEITNKKYREGEDGVTDLFQELTQLTRDNQAVAPITENSFLDNAPLGQDVKTLLDWYLRQHYYAGGDVKNIQKQLAYQEAVYKNGVALSNKIFKDESKLKFDMDAVGYLYELEINEKAIDSMLLWDAPLSKQPKVVQQAYEKYTKEYITKKRQEGKQPTDKKSIQDHWNQIKDNKAQSDLEFGLYWYRQMDEDYKYFNPQRAADGSIENSQKVTSMWLLENGIRGVKYKTGSTRNKTDRADFNYVMFDVSDITVTARNGDKLTIEEQTEGEIAQDDEGNVLAETVHNPKDAKLLQQAKKHDTFQSFLRAQGKRYYHGTLGNFQVFDNSKKGSNTDAENTNFGFFFIGDKKRAYKFTNDTRERGDSRPVNVIPAYIEAKKTLDITQAGLFSNKKQAPDLAQIMFGEKLSPTKALERINEEVGLGEIGEFYDLLYTDADNLAFLKSKGYDSAVSEFGRDGGKMIKEFIAFDADQIRTELQLQEIYRQANPAPEPTSLPVPKFTDYEVAEKIRQYTNEGDNAGRVDQILNTRFSKWLEVKRLGRSELPVKKGGYMTLYRVGEMKKGRIQSYSQNKQWDTQKPYKVHYDDILLSLDSDAVFDQYTKAYSGKNLDDYSMGLVDWVYREGSEVLVRTNNTKPAIQPRDSEGRWTSPTVEKELSEKVVGTEYAEVAKRVNKAEKNPQSPSRFLKRVPSKPSQNGDLKVNNQELQKGSELEYKKLIRRQEIGQTLANELGVVVRYGKFRQAASGIYKIKEGVIRMSNKHFRIDRQGGNFTTLVHESGHYIDYAVHPFRKAIPKEELRPLLEQYGGGYDTVSAREKRPEAFAEFLRYYITEPTTAKKKAPQFYKYFEETLTTGYPEVLKPLQVARNDFQNWLDQPAVSKVASQIDFEGKNRKSRVKDFFTSTTAMFREVVDDIAGIKKFDERSYMLARNARGWSGRANYFLEHGTVGAKFWKKGDNGKNYVDIKGKSLKAILKGVEEKSALSELSTYLVAKRSIELTGRGIVSGVDIDDAKMTVLFMEKKHQDFIKVSQELDVYQTQLLEYLVESGSITKDSFNAMKELNKSYTPFYRVHEELESAGQMGSGGNKNPIKRIKGSEQLIVDPIESIIRNTYSLVYAAQQNQPLLAMREAANSGNLEKSQMFEQVPVDQELGAKVNPKEIVEKAMGLNEFSKMFLSPEQQKFVSSIPEDLVNIFRPAFQQKGNVVTVMVEGKPEYYVAEESLYKAIEGLNREDVALAAQIAAIPAKFLRAGATLAPDFMLRNPLRDTGSAAIISKNNFIPVYSTVRGMASVIKQDEYYQAWLLSGGDMATLVSQDRNDVRKTRDTLLRRSAQIKQYIVNPLQAFRLMSNFTEQATRVGEMRGALMHGKDPAEAAYDSRNVSSDFGRHGAATAAISTMSAFFNARVQGFTILAESIKERPLQTMTKGTLYYTIPTILLYLINRDDPEYWEIPRWQKDLFWLVKLPNGVWLRIPKPFEVGTIFATLPERFIEYVDKKDPRAIDGLFDLLVMNNIPIPTPTAVTPIVENLTNYSFFLDRPIVGQGQQNLPNEFQYTNYTSEVAKFIGTQTGTSPIKVDNLLNGYFATLGRYTLDAVDGILEGTGVVASITEPTKQPSDLPIIKSFVVRPPSGSQSNSVNLFYKERERATKAYNGYKLLLEEGRTDEARKYFVKHPEIRMKDTYNTVARDISEIRKARDAVYDSETLSADRKREIIDKLNETMTTVSYRAINIELK